ncbi:hypothetical protein FAM09_13575 [Niastella caeni]|uniref:Uncharacterized protein n=1 Tax=Niastella caeni TaxID=2569763 RepID=A0A4S8HXL5_9BACT|nr:hypothetical protein [Niastella caeni]THU39529.1 hypothetical protein FAM09_13575 [Niastella caeni]
MSNHYFSKDFAKKFRSKCELYAPTQEYQYGNLLIKHFEGNKAEMAVIGERLTEKFFNTEVISQIILTLKNEGFPAAGKLFNMAITLKNIGKAYLLNEHYTACYYSDLTGMLDSFSNFLHAFKVDFGEKVCGQLATYYVHGSSANLAPECASLIPVIELTDFYLNNLSTYYNYFTATWQYEATNGKGVQATNYMADYLQALIMCTEETKTCIENIRSLLLTWEAQMQLKEEQELYN